MHQIPAEGARAETRPKGITAAGVSAVATQSQRGLDVGIAEIAPVVAAGWEHDPIPSTTHYGCRAELREIAGRRDFLPMTNLLGSHDHTPNGSARKSSPVYLELLPKWVKSDRIGV